MFEDTYIGSPFGFPNLARRLNRFVTPDIDTWESFANRSLEPPSPLVTSRTLMPRAPLGESRRGEQLMQLSPYEGSLSMFRPVFNISETSDSWLISAELPGVHKENICIDLREGMLTICGTKEAKKKHEDEQFRTVERSFGSFSRSMRLPESVSPNNIKASFENGVLEICICKPEGYTEGTSRIPIEGMPSKGSASDIGVGSQQTLSPGKKVQAETKGQGMPQTHAGRVVV